MEVGEGGKVVVVVKVSHVGVRDKAGVVGVPGEAEEQPQEPDQTF